MKRHLMKIVVLVITGLSGGTLLAEQTAYITDSLLLRVYSSADETSSVLETIDSGDSIELLEKQGDFSKVRIYDGTVGWIKSAFIVEEPPAKLLYYSVSEQNKELKQQIETLQNNSSGNDEIQQVEELEQALAKQRQLNLQLQEQLTNLERTVELSPESTDVKQTIRTKIATHNYSKQIPWLIAVAIALVILSFLFGLKVSSLRMRKRLHGFRLE